MLKPQLSLVCLCDDPGLQLDDHPWYIRLRCRKCNGTRPMQPISHKDQPK
jgi:hypothetical protein